MGHTDWGRGGGGGAGGELQAAAVSVPPTAMGHDKVTDTGDVNGSLKNKRKENEKRSKACEHRRPKRKITWGNAEANVRIYRC